MYCSQARPLQGRGTESKECYTPRRWPFRLSPDRFSPAPMQHHHRLKILGAGILNPPAASDPAPHLSRWYTGGERRVLVCVCVCVWDNALVNVIVLDPSNSGALTLPLNSQVFKPPASKIIFHVRPRRATLEERSHGKEGERKKLERSLGVVNTKSLHT